jgi:hypothetical protein
MAHQGAAAALVDIVFVRREAIVEQIAAPLPPSNMLASEPMKPQATGCSSVR